MDPYAVLGLGRDAGEEEITRAYRALAKRHHPDRAGEQGAHAMAAINAAYDMLRDAPAPAPSDPPPPGPGPDGGLAAALARRLGSELASALEGGEEVLMAADAATWDSHEVRLLVTDRRLLWLRDDAITDRVRHVRFSQVTSVEARLRRPLRRVGELRLDTTRGRRLRFGEIAPATLQALHALVEARSAGTSQ